MTPQYSFQVVPDQTTDGEPCYMAYHPELEGCMSHGDTIGEALENLDAARDLYFATLNELGRPIPPPSFPKPIVAIWESSAVTSEATDILPLNVDLPSQELSHDPA